MNCPDCLNAKISQSIKLEYNRCPDCGGKYRKGKWISAPKYPESDEEYLELMGPDYICNVQKRAGVWRNSHVRRVG